MVRKTKESSKASPLTRSYLVSFTVATSSGSGRQRSKEGVLFTDLMPKADVAHALCKLTNFRSSATTASPGTHGGNHRTRCLL